MDDQSSGDSAVRFRAAHVANQDSPPGDSRRTLLSLLALIAITLGSLWAALNAEWVQALGGWGYLGVAAISFLSSATVVLPAPGLAVVFGMGGAFNPVLLGTLAGIASGVGELSGYIAGASGRQLVDGQHINPWVHRLTTKYTVAALFLLALLPLPIFDFAGIVAGAMRVRLLVFLGAVIPGKIVKHVLVALMGAGFLPVLRLFIGL